jgi:outer membrane protein assembly factor BamB
LWSFGADNWFLTRPLVVGGTVYAGSLDHRLYALDADTGEERWRQELEAPVRASAVLAGGVVIAVDRDGNLYGVDPSDGEEVYGPIWLESDVLADPLLVGEEVLLSSTGGELLRIQPETGRRMETIDLRGPE